MTIKTYAISMLICLVIGGYVGWSIKPTPKPIKPDVLVEYRFINKTDTLVVPKFHTVIKKDTIKYSDTVFVHNETNYIAQVDTTYEDSSLTAHVQYVSPIPLSPKSYFNLKFGVREKTITNTIVQTEESYIPNHYTFRFGAIVHSVDTVRVNLLGELSYNIMDYKHFKFPITVGVELNDDFSIRDKYIKATGELSF